MLHGFVGPFQIHKLHQFAKEVLPTAECLMTAVVSREVVEQLEAVADEAVAQGTWFEVWGWLTMSVAVTGGRAIRLS